MRVFGPPSCGPNAFGALLGHELRLFVDRECAICRTGATGLEPATSGVTGRRSNQLNYAPWMGRPV